MRKMSISIICFCCCSSLCVNTITDNSFFSKTYVTRCITQPVWTKGYPLLRVPFDLRLTPCTCFRFMDADGEPQPQAERDAAREPEFHDAPDGASARMAGG